MSARVAGAEPNTIRALVYLSLVKLGPCKAIEIERDTGLIFTQVMSALSRLKSTDWASCARANRRMNRYGQRGSTAAYWTAIEYENEDEDDADAIGEGAVG